jgi:hypothetical protein
MGTSTEAPTSPDVAVTATEVEVVVGDPAGNDSLAGFDKIVAGVAQKSRESAERTTHDHDDQEQFLAGFQSTCQSEVRPAMQAVLERLQHAGGGGLIEEHAGDQARVRNPRLTMWMSLEGEIAGDPRPDRHPYLELDADMVGRNVQVSEGDMWLGAGGGRSGRVAVWQLAEITHDRVVEELLAIAQRAAA